MTRHGYSEDIGEDPLKLGRWRAIIASATRGKRGQKFFRQLAEALDAMPVKRLVAGELRADGGVCVLGALGMAQGIPLDSLDTDDHEQLGEAFDVAAQLTQEAMFMNDQVCSEDTPGKRWEFMRDWVRRQIRLKPTELEAEP